VLLTQYCSGDQIENETGGACSTYGESTGVYRVLVGKPGGKRPLGRPGCRWENNIKMDLQEMGCDGMDWIDVAQDRDRWRALVNAVMNLRFPRGIYSLPESRLASQEGLRSMEKVSMCVIGRQQVPYAGMAKQIGAVELREISGPLFGSTYSLPGLKNLPRLASQL
jgi:hypothetical protein